MMSIITPIYNGEKFIQSCLESVIEQNCPTLEHLIIDGGSQDRTVEIIKQYSGKYSHIRWISEKDQGQSDAMNKGIKMARGSIVGTLNVDDYYEQNVLNRVAKLFEDLPEPSLVYGNCNVWDKHNRLLFKNEPGEMTLVKLLIRAKLNKNKKLDFHYPVNPAAYFYHKSLHDQIGYYPVEEHYSMDVDFLIRAVKSATVKYVDETWGNFRHLPGTKTYTDKQSGNSRNRVAKSVEKYLNNISVWERLQVSLGKLKFRIEYFSAYPERLSEAMQRKIKNIFH